MQEPKSLSEGLTILKDEVISSQQEIIDIEIKEEKAKKEQQKQDITKDVMKQIQKRKTNKYIAIKFPKKVDSTVKETILKEIYETFKQNAKLYSVKRRGKSRNYSGYHIDAASRINSNLSEEVYFLIDNRRMESKGGTITISYDDFKKSIK